jgi:hypothetical protein
MVCDPAELLALATDNTDLDVGDLPVFGLDDADGIANLIEAHFLTSPPAAAG